MAPPFKIWVDVGCPAGVFLGTATLHASLRWEIPHVEIWCVVSKGLRLWSFCPLPSKSTNGMVVPNISINFLFLVTMLGLKPPPRNLFVQTIRCGEATHVSTAKSVAETLTRCSTTCDDAADKNQNWSPGGTLYGHQQWSILWWFNGI